MDSVADSISACDAFEVERLRQQAPFYAASTRDLLKAGGLVGAKRILEIACGAGSVTEIILEQRQTGAELVSVDRSATAVREVQRRFAQSEKFTALEMDASQQLPEGSFDVIVGRLILMYITTRAPLLQALHRRLNPGGALILQEAVHDNYMATTATCPTVELWRGRMLKASADTGITLSLGHTLGDELRLQGLSVTSQPVNHDYAQPSRELCEMFANTARSLEWRMRKAEILRREEFIPATLGGTFYEELQKTGASISASTLVGVIAR